MAKEAKKEDRIMDKDAKLNIGLLIVSVLLLVISIKLASGIELTPNYEINWSSNNLTSNLNLNDKVTINNLISNGLINQKQIVIIDSDSKNITIIPKLVDGSLTKDFKVFKELTIITNEPKYNCTLRLNETLQDCDLLGYDKVTTIERIEGTNWNESGKFIIEYETQPNSKGKLDIVICLDNDCYLYDPWWNSSFIFKRKLTIEQELIDADLTNFTIAVELNSSNFNFTRIQADGDDVRFVNSAEATELPYELEFINSTHAVYWVLIPTIDDAVDTDIYMYYGHSGATAGNNTYGTWDTDYEAVYHLGSTSNSGSNTYALTNTGTVDTITGMLGNAYGYSGTNEYSATATSATIDGGEVRLLTFWVKDNDPTKSAISTWVGWGFTSAENQAWVMVKNYETGLNHYTKARTYRKVAGTIDMLYPVVADNSWTHWGLEWNFSVGTMYRNGVIVNTTTISPNTAASYTYRIATSTISAGSECLTGYVDEVRIMKDYRGAAWVKAEYHLGVHDLITYGDEEATAFDYILWNVDPALDSTNYTFNLTVIVNTSLINASTVFANFTFNGTTYQPDVRTQVLGNVSFNKTLTMPILTILYNATVNNLWAINYTNYLAGTVFVNVSNTTTIKQIWIGNCSTIGSPAINFSLLDEVTNLSVMGDLNLNVTIVNLSVTKQFSFDLNNKTNFTLCINGGPLKVYTEAEYFNGSYPLRGHYLIDTTLSTSSVLQVYLYSLINTSSTLTQINVKDSTGNNVEGVIVLARRQYLGEGVIRGVAMCKTDDEGNCIMPLEWYYPKYDFQVYDATTGELLKQTVLTSIFATPVSITVPLIEAYNYWNRIANIMYNYTTSIVGGATNFTSNVIDLSGGASSVSLKCTKLSILGSTILYENTVSGSSVSLTCPLGNITGNEYYMVTTINYPLGDNIIYTEAISGMGVGAYGDEGVFITILVVAAFAVSDLVSPVLAVISAIIGLVVMNSFGFTYFTLPTIMSFIAISVAIAYLTKKRGT
jgi:hypothetical protein